MSTITANLETLLYNFIQAQKNHLVALYVFDRDGLVIGKYTTVSESKNEDVIFGAIAGIVETTLNRIGTEYIGAFGTGTFETDEHRLTFIEAGKSAILLSVFDPETDLGKILPYCYLIAEKVAQIVEGRLGKGTLTIPDLHLGYEIPISGTKKIHPLVRYNPQNEPINKEYQFKLCVIGDPSVGKTSLINQFTTNEFHTEYRPTLGISINNQLYNLQGFKNQQLNFMIWDIAGQKFFKRVRKYYYRDANAAFIVFDITREETFEERIDYWYKDIREVEPNIPIVLIGNKIDLLKQRKVQKIIAYHKAKKMDCSYLETSAKNGENVKDAFSIIGIGLFYKMLNQHHNSQDLDEII